VTKSVDVEIDEMINRHNTLIDYLAQVFRAWELWRGQTFEFFQDPL
jgi:hypothetical protein